MEASMKSGRTIRLKRGPVEEARVVDERMAGPDLRRRDDDRRQAQALPKDGRVVAASGPPGGRRGHGAASTSYSLLTSPLS